MSLFKSRKFAGVIAILMIITAVLFGGYRSLSAKRAEVERLFTTGGGDVLGLNVMLSIRKNSATWMLALADSVLDDKDDRYLAFKAARQAFVDAKSYSEICTANKNLDEPLYRLRGRTVAVMNKTDKTEFDKLYNEFLALSIKIDSHVYNREAQKFNDMLDKFPANVVALATPLDPIPLFME